MTEEEKAAAKVLQDKLDLENASKNGVLERMGNIEVMIGDLAKSVKPAEYQTTFDYGSVVAEDLAKSMASDPEAQKDFLDEFISNSHIDAIDLVDEEGFNLMTEDLKKSIDDGESEGAQILGLVLKTMDENNERAAKREGVIISLMSHMAKSFTETTEILTETNKELVDLKKSIGGTDLENIDGNIQNAGSSDLGGGGEDNIGGSVQDNTEVFSVLKKSFLEGKQQSEQKRYYEFTEYLSSGCTHAELQDFMDTNELEIYQSNF